MEGIKEIMLFKDTNKLKAKIMKQKTFFKNLMIFSNEDQDIIIDCSINHFTKAIRCKLYIQVDNSFCNDDYMYYNNDYELMESKKIKLTDIEFNKLDFKY